MILRLTILGQPVSGKNRRRNVPSNKHAGRVISIKSANALAYKKMVCQQVPIRQPLLLGKLIFRARLFYKWEGPDLDEGLLLDCLQGRVYKNDRQIREKHVYHGIDKASPRAEVSIEEVAA